MEKPNLIQEKSYSFALKIILTYKRLVLSKEPFAILNQLLRSGTSIGANVEEGIGGQTKKDFASKMSIAYKESRESHYWLCLFKDSENTCGTRCGAIAIRMRGAKKNPCLHCKNLLWAIKNEE